MGVGYSDEGEHLRSLRCVVSRCESDGVAQEAQIEDLRSVLRGAQPAVTRADFRAQAKRRRSHSTFGVSLSLSREGEREWSRLVSLLSDIERSRAFWKAT